MEATDGTQQQEVSRVAVQLPPFWAERPATGFVQAEAQFSLLASAMRGQNFTTSSELDHRYVAEVDITSPSQQDPYTKLRNELLNRLSLSREQRTLHLFTLKEMCYRKPSQFLR
jgi:hypothetical protein